MKQRTFGFFTSALWTYNRVLIPLDIGYHALDLVLLDGAALALGFLLEYNMFYLGSVYLAMFNLHRARGGGLLHIGG